MITVRVLVDGKLETGGLELTDRPGMKWVDVTGPTPELLAPLATRFKLHPLAVEDCLHLDQRPKLEEYPDHLFMVLHAFRMNGDVAELTMTEMHFLLGPDWLITVHEEPIAACEAAGKRLAADPGAHLNRGADFLMYVVADAVVDQNFPILDALSDEVDVLEDQIFEDANATQLQRIFGLKRALTTLRRVLSPQRDVVALLSRDGMPHIQQRSTLYFRDIYDHLVRIYEQIDATRDLLSSSMDAYLSMVANRTNDITKQLTIFATIFLPLSFITGFFGQNFEVLSHRGFFIAMLCTVFGFPLVLVWWFRKKGWV